MECNCTPWDIPMPKQMPTSNGICKDIGSECFWKMMRDDDVMERNCFCLSDCSVSKFSHFDTIIPMTEENCNVGKYTDIEDPSSKDGYYDESGDYLGPSVNWSAILSENVLSANPTSWALLQKLSSPAGET